MLVNKFWHYVWMYCMYEFHHGGKNWKEIDPHWNFQSYFCWMLWLRLFSRMSSLILRYKIHLGSSQNSNHLQVASIFPVTSCAPRWPRGNNIRTQMPSGRSAHDISTSELCSYRRCPPNPVSQFRAAYFDWRSPILSWLRIMISQPECCR